MTLHIIKMPDIGEGIAEVELVAWRVAAGDTIAEDQILADVMTDKATVEIPSHVAGRVIRLDATVGQVVAVGSAIIHIETAEASMSVLTPAGNPYQTVAGASPSADTVDAQQQVRQVVGTEAIPAGVTFSTEAHERPIAAPAVRRRAWELGINLALVKPSGPAGRITHADLLSHAQKHPATAPIPGHSAAAPETEPAGSTTIAVLGLRRKIAQKMQESKRRIPHFSYVEEIDVTELQALRALQNAQHEQTRGRLSMLPFLIRALVLALREHPEVNARYDDDATVLTRFQAVHLGIATQTEAGLMVPVIRHAEKLDLWACATEIRRLSTAARNGKITREELSGSTITLSSLGALGGIASTPVINYPEVAIVGTNRMVERPVVKAGQVVVRTMMNLSSSFDHRVVDGMHAAEFIQRLRSYLECPASLFLP